METRIIALQLKNVFHFHVICSPMNRVKEYERNRATGSLESG